MGVLQPFVPLRNFGESLVATRVFLAFVPPPTGSIFAFLTSKT